MSYLCLQYKKGFFDCCHLVALYLEKELEIDVTYMNGVSRSYDLFKEREYMFEHMLKNDMVEMPPNSICKKGDVFLYELGRRCCACVCTDDTIALVMHKKSTLIHVERLGKIFHHLRHKSLL